jgi:ribonuclease HI
MDRRQLYADGVAGRGGWAALIERDGSTEQLVGSAMGTTQNRMELTAACEALERVTGVRSKCGLTANTLRGASTRTGIPGGAGTTSGGRPTGR